MSQSNVNQEPKETRIICLYLVAIAASLAKGYELIEKPKTTAHGKKTEHTKNTKCKRKLRTKPVMTFAE